MQSFTLDNIISRFYDLEKFPRSTLTSNWPNARPFVPGSSGSARPASFAEWVYRIRDISDEATLLHGSINILHPYRQELINV
jgi:hypothetical protein